MRPAPAEDMTWVPGGSFPMGSEELYPEERPVRRVTVEGFRIDVHPVTVARFRRFVKDTGHVTVASARPTPPTSRTPTRPCACPARAIPLSTSRTRTRGPTYAAWAGRALPTEAEWERAARGGLEGARFA